MILLLTHYLIRSVRSKKRIILGSVFATLFVPLQMYGLITSGWVKIVYSIGIILVTFGWQGILTFCKTIGVFYFISFSIGGGMFGFHYLLSDLFAYSDQRLFLTAHNIYGDEVNLMFLFISFPIVWLFTKRRMDGHVQAKIKYDQFYEVVLMLNGQSLKTTGYLDSGNHLIDPITKRPVVICDATLLQRFFSEKDWKAFVHSMDQDDYSSLPTSFEHKVFIVPFQGVGGETSYLYCLKPDLITIYYEGKVIETSHVLVGVQLRSLTESEHYHCLLHPQLIHLSKIKSA